MRVSLNPARRLTPPVAVRWAAFPAVVPGDRQESWQLDGHVGRPYFSRGSSPAREWTCVRSVKIVVEKHPDGYVAYPLGLKGVIVGEGDTYEEVLADVTSAIRFHIETFGSEVLEGNAPVLEAFIAEAHLPV